MDTPEAVRLLGQHWAPFVAAVFDPEVRAQPGGVQQYVWASLNNYYASRGESLPKGSFQAVNRLLSLAGQQRAAQLSLSRTLAAVEQSGVDRMLAAQQIAPSVNARPLSQLALGPEYRVTYVSSHIVDGVPQRVTLTHDLGRDLPQSASQLRQVVEQAAQLQAADYDFEWGGIATPIAIQSY